MNKFNLKDGLNKVVEELKTTIGSRNIVKANIDSGIPQDLKGENQLFLSNVKNIANKLAENLINGILQLEFKVGTPEKDNIVILSSFVGSGAPGVESEYYKDVGLLEKEMVGVANKIQFHCKRDRNKIYVDFSFLFSRSETEDPDDNAIFPNKSILLVEDNEVNIIVFSSFLEEFGAEYSVAHNGKEALDITHSKTFDAILMDIQMPVMDGVTAIREIRKKDKKTPIIVLSALGYKEDVDRALDAGANEFLRKPVSSWELQSSLIKNFNL